LPIAVPTYPVQSVGRDVGRLMGKLSTLAVKAATTPGSYQDGEGLMLVVKASGSRSWVLRTQVDGKRRDFGLGSVAKCSLAEAREKAAELRKLYHAGVDPIAKKRAEKLARVTIPTFREAADQCHAEQRGGWRNVKHRGDWLSSLRSYAFPAIGKERVDHITAPMVRDLLLPIWLEKPETARRVRQRVRTVLGWAASKGFRPALDLTVMDAGLPKQPKRANHFRAMEYEKVPAFVATVRAAPETVGRLALLFTILTAARSGETRGATWEEIDLEAATWTIPASRMKAGRMHVVPLSLAALAILDRAKELRTGRAGEPIFPGKGGAPVSDMTISKVLRDMKLSDTVHGFRSAFKDWASEATSFPDAVSEAALAHVDRDKTRAAYKRTSFLEMRGDLMAAWAAYVDGTGGAVADLADARRRKRLAG
jgi:integrase